MMHFHFRDDIVRIIYTLCDIYCQSYDLDLGELTKADVGTRVRKNLDFALS